MRRISRLGGTRKAVNKATRCKVKTKVNNFDRKVKVKHPWALVCNVQAVKITSTIFIAYCRL